MDNELLLPTAHRVLPSTAFGLQASACEELREAPFRPQSRGPNWVREMPGVKPGEVIKASDPRNPLGKMKIPLGDSYLIHQAR